MPAGKERVCGNPVVDPGADQFAIGQAACRGTEYFTLPAANALRDRAAPSRFTAKWGAAKTAKTWVANGP